MRHLSFEMGNGTLSIRSFIKRKKSLPAQLNPIQRRKTCLDETPNEASGANYPNGALVQWNHLLVSVRRLIRSHDNPISFGAVGRIYNGGTEFDTCEPKNFIFYK